MKSRPLRPSCQAWKISSKLSLFLGFLILLDGCKTHRQAGESEAYIENGRIWAYGTVQLTGLSDQPKILIKRGTGVQGLDADGVEIQGPKFSLVGTIDDAELKELAYVDYHPELDRVIAYHYSVEYIQRGQNTIDLFGVLRKSGRSYYQRQKVYLGQANIADGAESGSVQLAEGLKVSEIVSGVFSGQWAFHYPDVKHIVIRPWSGMCTKSVTQRPGQTPGQNPGQFDTCRPMPKEHDLCAGDPTRDGCRPTPMVQKPVLPGEPEKKVEPTKVVTGLETVSADDQVFTLHDDIGTAKIVFVSETRTVADAGENAATCAIEFMAVGRTVNRQINESCMLKPAPAEPVDGKLTCAVTVVFDQASTYLENVCNITAVFRGTAAETQVIQVLRKQ